MTLEPQGFKVQDRSEAIGLGPVPAVDTKFQNSSGLFCRKNDTNLEFFHPFSGMGQILFYLKAETS
jgi:hypothetical protein